MKMFELLPRPLGSIFRKLTHLTCNSREIQFAGFHASAPERTPLHPFAPRAEK